MDYQDVQFFTDLQILQKKEVKQFPKFEADSSMHVGQFLIDQIGSSAQEHGYVFFFDVHHKLIGYAEVGKGSDTECMVSVKVILQHALLCGAYAIIFAHNHPTGCLEPSDQDQRFSNKLYQACKLLEIEVLDTMIIGRSTYYSVAE